MVDRTSAGREGIRRDRGEFMDFPENPFGVPTIGGESILERSMDWITGADRNQGAYEGLHDYAEYTPERARIKLYEELALTLLHGGYLTPNEMGILSYGLLRDPVADKVSVTPWDIKERLDQIEEFNPGSTMLPQWEAWWAHADSVVDEGFLIETLADIAATLVTGGTGGAAFAIGRRAAARSAAANLGKRVGKGISEAAIRRSARVASAAASGAKSGAMGVAETGKAVGRFLGSVGSGIGKHLSAHKKGYIRGGMGLAAVGAVVASMANQTGEEGGQVQPGDPTIPTQTDAQGNPIYDEATGEYVGPGSQNNPGFNPFTGEFVPYGDETGPITNVHLGADFNPNIANLLAAYGIDVRSADLTLPGYYFGDTQVRESRFPAGLTFTGQTPASMPEWVEGEGWRIGSDRFIRPQATINPEVLSIDPTTGKSLIELADEASDRWGVPIGILYGVINRTSGWNRQAISGDGSSAGLSLIPFSDDGYEFKADPSRGYYDSRLGTWVLPRKGAYEPNFGTWVPPSAWVPPEEGAYEPRLGTWVPPEPGAYETPYGYTPITIRMGTGVTRRQASNPSYAINWMASRLAQSYQKYGGWDAAIISAASPSGAEYYHINGDVESDYDFEFLVDVLSMAQDSSLLDVVIDTDRIKDIINSRLRGGGTGASLPAYQAPDPASLRNYARDMTSRVLNRKATDTETDSALAYLNNLFRKQYDANIRKIQGMESVEVNPEERYREALTASGEGQFRESATETGSVLDYAAQVARILQEGY